MTRKIVFVTLAITGSLACTAQQKFMMNNQWAVITATGDTCFEKFSATSEKEDKLIDKGKKQIDRDKYNKGIALFEEALKLNEENAQAHGHLGKVYADLNRHGKAIHHFTQQLAIQPCNDFAYYQRGVTHLKSEAYPTALKDFNAALQLDANNPMYQTKQGFVLLQTGQVEHGCQILEPLEERLLSLEKTVYEQHCPVEQSE